MDLKEVLALYDRDQRREIEFPGMTREVFPNLVRFARPAPGMSFILFSDLAETEIDRTIEEQIDYFTRLKRRFHWKAFSHDRPHDMAQRLIARGFEPEEEDVIMVLDVANAPDSLLEKPAAGVRRLTDPAQLADVVAVLESVWGGDFNWVYERMGEHMAIPGYLSIYVAYVDETPACVGWIYYNKGEFSGLWGGSSLELFRGRGLYKAVLSARVQEARQRGVRNLTIDAGTMSRPILARHGFEVISYATSCEWKGNDQADNLETEGGFAQHS